MDVSVHSLVNSPVDPWREKAHFLINQLAEIQALSLSTVGLAQKHALLERIVQVAMQLVEGEGACLFLAYPEQQELEVYIERNPTPFQFRGIRLAYGEGAAGWVAKECKPLLIEDYATWPLHSQKFGPPYIYRSVISAPLVWDNHLEGVLQVFNVRSDRRFTEEELKLLSLFANQASLVLQSAALLEKERRQRVLAETLASAAQALSASLHLETLLEIALDQLAQVLPHDRAAIFLLQGDVLTLKAQRGWRLDPSAPPLAFPATLPMVRELASSQAIKVIADVAGEGGPQELLSRPGVGAWMGVPLIANGTFIGLIALESDRPHGFEAGHVAWVSVFAQTAALAITNACLYQLKEEQNQTLESLRRTSLSLTSNLDLSKVLSDILHAVHQFFSDLRNAYVFLYTPENGGELHFGAQLWPEEGDRTPFYQPRPNGLTIQVARSGELMVVPEVENHPLFRDLPGNWKGAILGMPLKIGDRVVGVMNVTFPTPRQFTPRELSLLAFLGDQAAIAIENARLYQRVEAERRKLDVIYAIGHQLNSSLEPDEILQRAIRLATQALDGHIGLAYRYLPEEKTLSLRAVWGAFPTSIEEYNRSIRWDGERGFIGWVMKHCQADLIPDVTQDERWWHHPIYDQGVRSAIAAPILFEERLYGLLAVFHTQPDAFGEADLELVKAICQELGLALSNAERYQEAKHRLRQMTLLHKLTQNFSRHLDLEELLRTIVEELTANFHYPIIEVYLRQEDHFQLRAHSGNGVLVPQISPDRGVIGRAVRTALPQIVFDVTQDPDYLPDNPQTVAEFVVPILLHDQVMGVLNIEIDQHVSLSPADVHFFQLLADQIGIALENATLYESVRCHADELEGAVARRTAELAELYQLSQEIGGALTYSELMQTVLGHLRSAAKCDFAVGCLLLHNNPILYVNAQRPFSETALAALRRHCQAELKQALGVEIARFSIEVSVVDQDSSAASIQGFHSIPNYPIVLNGRVIGKIGIADEHTQVFAAEHLQLLQTFANQASIAFQRLESLREAEKKRLSDLLEHLSVGVLLLDSDYRILLMNPIAREWLDVLQAEIEGEVLCSLGAKPVQDLLHRSPHALPLEITVESPRRRIFEVEANPIGEPPERWVITLREVTLERETQMRVQMQERLATVGQLAAGIAHDFNNIMAAILVYADLLRHDPSLSEVAQERLGIIQQQVQRAASLIRQILDFSRRSVMEQIPLDLLPFVKEFQKMLSRVFPETIRVELKYEEREYAVLADPTRLQQMLMNLALNARDAMPQGGTLRISLAHLSVEERPEASALLVQPGEWVVIEVQDTGHGIASEHLPHIFEPFFTTKPAGLGTGLGLAQVYGIVKQHGGYIEVQSQPGQGATFTIYLPALKQPARPAPEERSTVLVDGRGKVVLVVEDDAATRNALKALLEAQHYQVLTARDGTEALRYWELHHEEIELVISDVVMPRMGGVELYQTLRTHRPDLKMLLLTGHPLSEEYRRLLERGQIRWLQKPFSVAELNQAIRTLVAAAGEG